MNSAVSAGENSILKQAGLKKASDFSMRYAVVIEKVERNYAVYVPDLPDCIATGQTLEEIETQIQEAIQLHLHGMQEDGLPIPESSSQIQY